MAGLNRAQLIGNLGSDPRRADTKGNACCNFRVATSRKWTNGNGERREATDWHDVVCWGKVAEHCLEYLKKGRQVFIEGRLQTREWTDRDKVKRWSTEIVATNVQFLGAK